jgi:hypothetical protein
MLHGSARIQLHDDDEFPEYGLFAELAQAAPQPLTQPTPDGGGITCRSFAEGARVQLSDRAFHTPYILFELSLIGSMALDGQPLRCSGVLPGISMRISVKTFPSAHRMEPRAYCERLWKAVQPPFEAWLVHPAQAPAMTIEIEKPGLEVTFARDSKYPLAPGVMQFDMVD